jgi:hypothetical protein
MMAIPIHAHVQQHILQLVNLCHTGSTKEIPWNWVFGEMAIPKEYLYLTRIRHHAAEHQIGERDPPDNTTETVILAKGVITF